MEKYVEFSGKDVDDAIANACKHFGIERDKLEIEIVSGGSSGIFGLVGVKKARILAQKRGAVEQGESLKTPVAPSRKTESRPATKPVKAKSQPAPEPKQKSESTPKPVPESKSELRPETKPESKPRTGSEPKPLPEQEPRQDSLTGSSLETETKEEIKTEIEKMSPGDLSRDSGTDDPELREYIHDLLVNLTKPLSPDAVITVNDRTKPISVIIKDETTSEILIGRDGQTLSAIQYIANRIIAKNRPGAARVQLDTEDFLEKQNEKLQENAFLLATKAKKIGKTMSTRPLSSYHRRIVHMALQNDKKIRTKSKGDGPMKRVLIMPKQRRKKPSQE